MINFSAVKSVTIPEGKVKQITKDGVVLWKGGYKNWMPLSTESDGVTIYNGGLGYKDGYRVRSGGAEGASANNCCTGFIPCKAGDVIRFTTSDGRALWTDYEVMTAFNFYDTSKTHLGQFTSQPAYYGIFVDTGEADKVTKANGVWQYTVIANSDIAFMRLTAPVDPNTPAAASGANLIITINEEIT